MYKEILAKIEEYDQISIFRHQRPDGDCMFSVMAMEQFIKDNFPQKKVKVGGYDTYDLVSRNDKISDKFIKGSLCIVLDNSRADRMDDERGLKAPFVIKIDHHPPVDNYGTINLVDPKAAACAEILAKMFMSKDFKGLILSEKTCEYLYCAIVSDTINFRTTSTTSETLSIASKLVKKGDLKPSDLTEFVQDKDIVSFQKTSKIRNMLKIQNHFGYVVFRLSDMKKLDLTRAEAKNNIDEFGRIKDLNIWSVATENEEGLYDVSVRSKSGFTINQILTEFGGGGHANAAATRNLTKKQMDDLYNILSDYSIKK